MICGKGLTEHDVPYCTWPERALVVPKRRLDIEAHNSPSHNT